MVSPYGPLKPHLHWKPATISPSGSEINPAKNVHSEIRNGTGQPKNGLAFVLFVSTFLLSGKERIPHECEPTAENLARG
jgi:hypothetical protein